MIKKICILLLSFSAINFFLACTTEAPCPEVGTYRWNNLSTDLLANEVVTSADSIVFSDFGIRIALEPLQIASYRRGISLVNTAFARSCVEYEMESYVHSITIKTLSDFDGDHPAGSIITSYCKGRSMSGGDYVPADQMKNEFNPLPPEINSKLNMVFTKQPDSTGNYQFVIRILLGNGIYLIDTTKSVVLY